MSFNKIAVVEDFKAGNRSFVKGKVLIVGKDPKSCDIHPRDAVVALDEKKAEVWHEEAASEEAQATGAPKETKTKG